MKVCLLLPHNEYHPFNVYINSAGQTIYDENSGQGGLYYRNSLLYIQNNNDSAITLTLYEPDLSVEQFVLKNIVDIQPFEENSDYSWVGNITGIDNNDDIFLIYKDVLAT